MNWFTKFSYWLSRAMAGRHGGDQLSVALLVLYCVLLIISDILRLPVLFYAALIFLLFSLYRMMSRNHERRWKENAWFLSWWNPFSRVIRGSLRRTGTWCKNTGMRFRDRKVYRYYRCPKCKNTLRVPKKRGKIVITCPVCRTEFIRKT